MSYITTFVTNSDNMARLTLCFSTIWDVFTPSLVPMLGFWRHFLKHPLKLLCAVCTSGNITFLVLLGHLNISSLVACFLHDLLTGVHMLLDYKKREGRCFGVYFGKCKSRAILQFVLIKGYAVYNNQWIIKDCFGMSTALRLWCEGNSSILKARL